jgi:HK97 family phage major capsid protein
MSVKKQIERVKTQRGKLIADVRAIVNTAEKENREVNADEASKLDKMQTDIDSLDARVQTLENMLAADPGDDESDRDDDPEKTPTNTANDDRSKKYKEGDSIILPNGLRAVVQGSGSEKRIVPATRLEQRDGESDTAFSARKRRSSAEYRAGFVAYLKGGQRELDRLREKRTIVAGVDVDGGYLTAPEEFTNRVLKAADNYLFIRELATKFTVENAASLGVPTLDTDPDDADWTSELATGNEDNVMKFGKRELRPWPLARRLKISNQLLRMASVSGVLSVNDESQGGQGSGIVNFITGRLGYKFAVTQEKAFMLGTGQGQPLGVFVASSRGISTNRDVTTTATAAINFDSLMEAKYSLKVPYQPRGKWLFSRTAIRKIRQLKDSMGRYLWQESVQQGQPDKILDNEVIMSEYVPSVFTTGSYVGMFGDFSFYWIVEGASLQIQVLSELYAEQNLTGYIARSETDGMPALEEAFARIKLG